MVNTLIGQKVEQTQKFLQNGRRIPVTEIAVADNAVVQIKSTDKDTYKAVQLGTGQRKKANKALAGHAKKASLVSVPRILQEVHLQEDEGILKAGEMIALDVVFKPGDIVQVTGISKGKGFAGVVKRHHFRGGPKTHGQSDRLRAPGSIGQTTTPGRVYRGKRMAGRMGTETVTVRNLQVVEVDGTNKILSVWGLVPGHLDSFVCITRTGENKKFVPLMNTNTGNTEESQGETKQNEAPKQEEAPQIVEGAKGSEGESLKVKEEKNEKVEANTKEQVKTENTNEKTQKS